jgi:hypothetical protein
MTDTGASSTGVDAVVTTHGHAAPGAEPHHRRENA